MRFVVFALERLFQAAFVVWASVTLLFAIFFLLPGDRADQIIGGERLLDQQTRAAVTENLGLDEPAHVQYGRLWANLFDRDLGTSYVNGTPVWETIQAAAPASLRLTFWALVVELVAGLGTALLLSRWRSRTGNWLSTGVTALLLSAPVFVTGYLLQYFAGILPFEWGWPESIRPAVQGIGPDTWFGVLPTGEQWRYLLLPSIALGLLSGAVLHRLAVESLESASNSAYVRGAQARGVSRGRIVRRHVLRNALGPVIAFLGVDIALLFGSAVVTESVFGWPGVGGEMARALERADAPVIFGLAITIAVAYVLCSFLFELLHRVVDPRTGGVYR